MNASSLVAGRGAAPGDADQAPLLVEFVGLPGAGKTATAATIVSRMTRPEGRWGERGSLGRGAMSRTHFYGAAVAHQLIVQPSLLAALRMAWTTRPWRMASLRHALRVSHWGYALRRAERAGFEVLLLDQGVVQDTWSVILTGARWHEGALRTTLRRVLQGTVLSFAYVYLDVSVDVALGRLRRRPRTTSRFDAMTDAEARRLLSARQAELQALCHYAVEITGGQFCLVDASPSLESTCARVIEFLDSFTHHDSRRSEA